MVLTQPAWYNPPDWFIWEPALENSSTLGSPSHCDMDSLRLVRAVNCGPKDSLSEFGDSLLEFKDLGQKFEDLRSEFEELLSEFEDLLSECEDLGPKF